MTSVDVAEDNHLGHVVDDDALANLGRELTGLDVESRVGKCLIRVRSTSELGDEASTCLGISTLDIAALTDHERGTYVELVELKASSRRKMVSEISVSGV